MDQAQPVIAETAPTAPTSKRQLPPWIPNLPPRDMPNQEDVLAMIDAWAEYRYSEISKIYLQKGGWEGWAQVELALAFSLRYEKINVFREETVYSGSNRRADLTLMLAGHQTQVVELKVESLWQDQSLGVSGFVNAVKEDISKITINSLKPAFRPALVYAVGISCGNDQVAAYTMEPSSWIPYEHIYRYEILKSSSSEHSPLIRWNVLVDRPSIAANDEHTLASSSRATGLHINSGQLPLPDKEPAAAQEHVLAVAE
jgi:hypothetical protein